MTEMPTDEDDALHEALWIAMLCRCDKCGEFFGLDEIDHLADEDTWRWATAAVRILKPLGWTSPYRDGWRSGDLNCPTCSRS